MQVKANPGMTEAETLGYLIGRALPLLVVLGNGIKVPDENKLRATALDVVHEIKAAIPDAFNADHL